MFLYQKIQTNITACLLLSTLFFIPLSPSLKSIFFGCTLIAILFTPALGKKLAPLFKTPWCITAYAFFAFVVLACGWSNADFATQWILLKKYSKFLLLPFLALPFANAILRKRGILVYIFSMLITVCASFLRELGFLQLKNIDPGYIFHNHIITGFMVAFAAYLAGLQAFQRKKARGIFILIFMVFSYFELFINTGRTAYVVYFSLIVLLLFQCISLKYLPPILLAFCSIFWYISHHPSALSSGIVSATTEWNHYQKNSIETSLGYRMQFHAYAKSLFLQSPVIGKGTGAFSAHFHEDKPVPSWGDELLDPHSLYWLLAAEQGLLGLLLYASFLIALLLQARRLSENKCLLQALVLSTMVGNLTECLTFYSAAGYLFIFLVSLCLGEGIQRSQP
jgi:hypothetical protein